MTIEEKIDLLSEKGYLKKSIFNLQDINDILRQSNKTSVLNDENKKVGINFLSQKKQDERKAFGQFYTPNNLVELIIKKLPIKKYSKIIDLSCGCGIFLVNTYQKLLRVGSSQSGALKNLFGVDLDRNARLNSILNVWVRTSKKIDFLEILEKNIRLGNSITKNKRNDYLALNLEVAFKGIIEKGGFDFVIGNPPYVTIRKFKDYDPKEYSKYNIANGSVNLASLMLVQAYKILKNDGYLAFVLPKTLTRVRSYQRLRKFIEKKFQIVEIMEIGQTFKDVRGEQIILFLKKGCRQGPIKVVFWNRVVSKEIAVKVKDFFQFGNFLLLPNKQSYRIIKKISRGRCFLSSFKIDIFRGANKAKYPHFNFINGSNIGKYHIDYKSKQILKFETFELARIKRRKIILQNIFSSESGIKAAYDRKSSLTDETVTNLVIKGSNISHELCLAILNSTLINYFLIFSVYGGSRLTMHTDGIYLKQIPMPDLYKNQKVICLIEKKVKKIDYRNPKEIKTIDRLVYHLYGLSATDYSQIKSDLKKIFSNKTWNYYYG